MADWQAIKTEYITTETSYRKLAEKYGVSRVQIGNVGKEENWVELKRQHLDGVVTKSLNLDEKKRLKTLERIQNATDRLLDKIEQAIDELDKQFVKHVDKTKTIEYNNDRRPDKPTKEIIHEEEKLIETVTLIDRTGLKAISSAIRDIKEIHMLKSSLDEKEQKARIANLEKMAEKESETASELTVIFEAGPEEWNE